jgi:hypothetical protein
MPGLAICRTGDELTVWRNLDAGPGETYLRLIRKGIAEPPTKEEP